MVKLVKNLPLSNYQHLHMKHDGDIRSSIGQLPFGPFRWYAEIDAGQELRDYEVKEESGKEETAFVYWYPNVFVTRSTTPPEMMNLMARNCHKAKLVGDSATYQYFLPKTFYSAFDYESSCFDRARDADGNEKPDGRLSFVRRYVLIASDLGGAPIFRVQGNPEDAGIRQKVFVSDEFFEVYQRTECTGLTFDEVECV